MKSNRTIILYLGILGVIISPFSIYAGPEIHFTEYKILLTDKKTSADYQIFNQGDSDASCSVQFIDFMIGQDGQLSIPKEGEKPLDSAASLLRGSPSRVIVPANGAQKVKVLIRGLRSQKVGELHSYLSLRCKENESKLENGVNLVPNFVFNLPVTVRKGQLTAKAEISDANLIIEESGQWLTLSLNRTGTRSLYGDFIIKDEAGSKIGELNGVSNYVQSTSVPINITLTKAPKGKVHIMFKEDSRFGGNEAAEYWLE
jgi:hypothetical protein